ncbi:Mobile element protein [Candidatus Enterovibrio altilux]|uniref:Mobile element protein n=1 Tax=Candidatus Enterovibrio altilux TaxID=1927128 RepID=A0A291BAJ3_9GAMM|nr:Mobile element protein [Candidatus Enterovibrio luxaltus]
MSYPHYSCIRKRVKTVNVTFKTKSKETIKHLVIDSTELKVCGAGKWRIKLHGTHEKRGV